jgi:hypothetical protein
MHGSGLVIWLICTFSTSTAGLLGFGDGEGTAAGAAVGPTDTVKQEGFKVSLFGVVRVSGCAHSAPEGLGCWVLVMGKEQQQERQWGLQAQQNE